MIRLLAGALTTAVLLVAWLTKRRAKPDRNLDQPGDAPLRAHEIDPNMVRMPQNGNVFPSAEAGAEVRGKDCNELPSVAAMNGLPHPTVEFLAPDPEAPVPGSLFGKQLDEYHGNGNSGLDLTSERATESGESLVIRPMSDLEKEPASSETRGPDLPISPPGSPPVSVGPALATPTLYEDFDQTGTEEGCCVESSNESAPACSESPVLSSHLRADPERLLTVEHDATSSVSEIEPTEPPIAVVDAPAASPDEIRSSEGKDGSISKSADDFHSGAGEHPLVDSTLDADAELPSIAIEATKALFTQIEFPPASDPAEIAKLEPYNGVDHLVGNATVESTARTIPARNEYPATGLPLGTAVNSRPIPPRASELILKEAEPRIVSPGFVIAGPTPSNGTQTEDIGSIAKTVGKSFPVRNGTHPKLISADVDVPICEHIDDSETEDTGEAPKRYRSPNQAALRQTSTRNSPNEAKRRSPNGVLLGVRVRLTFDRFGFCVIGLLPERTPQLDDEVRVTIKGNHFLLVSQDDWYQDLFLDEVGKYLHLGIDLRGVLADRRRVRWLLSGRDIFVLASNQSASGFVSTNRLALGRSHVVLYRQELHKQVDAILAEAGCLGHTTLTESHGIPVGWCGLRGVSPTKAISLDPGSDPFYPLKPAPDIEIELKGGICLRNSIWLAGYPPQITILGQQSSTLKVKIDGKEPQYLADGSLVAEGYDQLGLHSVYCDGLSCSRSYSIADAPETWEEWPAYDFGGVAICGPLVATPPTAANRRIFTVPMTNPILVGAEPDQVFRCSPRSVAFWKGFVPFEVVWALPLHPLTCDKKTSRIINFATTAVSHNLRPSTFSHSWCTAILDASRKGLRIESDTPDLSVIWREYKKVAKSILRRRR